MGLWLHAAPFFADALKQIAQSQSEGNSRFAAAIRSVVRYPIKAIAAFIFAPFLALRIAWTAKNPLRRIVAGVGLFISVLLALLAGTFVGTLTGAIFVLTHFGPLAALGLLVGTTFSVILSVAFSLLVLNTLSLVFLHVSAEDVLKHLQSISE